MQELLCNNCGYTGHSAEDCRHRKNAASAWRRVHYSKQNPEKKQRILDEIQKDQHRHYPANALPDAQIASISSPNESDQVDSLD